MGTSFSEDMWGGSFNGGYFRRGYLGSSFDEDIWVVVLVRIGYLGGSFRRAYLGGSFSEDI